jgi:hypothetical protein
MRYDILFDGHEDLFARTGCVAIRRSTKAPTAVKRRQPQGEHFWSQTGAQVSPRRQEAGGVHSSRQHIFIAGGGTTMTGCGMVGMGENWANAGAAPARPHSKAMTRKHVISSPLELAPLARC